MDEAQDTSREAVLVYINGAREALQSAQYNLDGSFYGVAVNRAYYAFYYADSDQAQAIVEQANRFVDRCQTYLAVERYL